MIVDVVWVDRRIDVIVWLWGYHMLSALLKSVLMFVLISMLMCMQMLAASGREAIS